MHSNTSSASADRPAFDIPLRIESVLPSFLTPSYYQQMIQNSYHWAEQNKKDIIVTAAITSIAHLTLGKRAGYTIFGAGIYRLWAKAEIAKIRDEQTKFNNEQRDANRSLTFQIYNLTSEVKKIPVMHALLEEQKETTNAIVTNLDHLTKKTDILSDKIAKNTDLIDSINPDDVKQVKEDISATHGTLLQLIKENKKLEEESRKVYQNVNALRQETKVITAKSANHIMAETKQLMQNPAYSPQEFDVDQALKNFYAQNSFGSFMARGAFRLPSHASSSKPH